MAGVQARDANAVIEPLPFIELLPREKLRIGMRVYRLEMCEPCKSDQCWEYQLQSATPRLWTKACTQCSRQLRQEA
jgi:hypothetical protein